MCDSYITSSLGTCGTSIGFLIRADGAIPTLLLHLLMSFREEREGERRGKGGREQVDEEGRREHGGNRQRGEIGDRREI